MKIIFLMLVFTIVSLPAYGQSNSTVTNENQPDPPHDVTILVVATILAIGLHWILKSSKKLQAKRLKIKKIKEKPDLIKSPYDKLTFEELESRSSKLSINYSILITIYAVLLAFIVSDKASYAFSSWYFVIWCGWILAIIIRIGEVINKLFEIEKESILKESSRIVYGAREFFKHALYLLIPTVAFLPTFYLAKTPSQENIKELPWEPAASILLAGISILAMFFMFYHSSMKIRSLTMRGGSQDTYAIVIILIVFGGLAGFSASPLEPMNVTLYSVGESQIPTILYALGLGGGLYLIAMVQTYWEFIPTPKDKK